MSERDVVVGLDGGGTVTRALCCGLDGQPLGYAEAGGASIGHNREEDARQHLQTAVQAALEQAGRSRADVRALVAGLAGLDKPEDHQWAQRLTCHEEIGGPRLHVNDSVVAHAGALLSRPGIIVIAGTGAITFGVNEAGRELRNYDFSQYADTAARALTLRCLHRLLVGDTDEEDSAFVQAVLDFWNVESVEALWQAAAQWGALPWTDKVHQWGRMAPLVTQYAQTGAPLPRAVCQEAAEQISISIRLVGAAFVSRPISVALIGSAARSPYMQQAVAETLERHSSHAYHLETPVLSPVAGAILIALKHLGITPDAPLLNRLQAHPLSRFSDHQVIR